MWDIIHTVVVAFTFEKYVVMESEEYVEIGMRLLGGSVGTSITATVTPIGHSAMGK